MTAEMKNLENFSHLLEQLAAETEIIRMYMNELNKQYGLDIYDVSVARHVSRIQMDNGIDYLANIKNAAVLMDVGFDEEGNQNFCAKTFKVNNVEYLQLKDQATNDFPGIYDDAVKKLPPLKETND